MFKNAPTGIRTRVFAVRGQRPRPLDDRSKNNLLQESKDIGKSASEVKKSDLG